MSRLALPNAESAVRVVLVRSIEDRKASRDTSVVTGPLRDFARRLLSEGGSPVWAGDENSADVPVDLSGGDTGAVR